jgi:hypothetical protein
MSAQNTETGVFTYDYGTDAAGAYSLTVAPGTYDVTTYTSTTSEIGVVFIEQSKTVTVASGEAKSGQNFALVRRGKFSGHVYVAGTTTPIDNAYVYVTNANGYTYGSAGTYTPSSGSFSFSPTPSGDITLSAVGTYTFYISKAGYFGTSVSNVVLAADEATTTQDVTLTPGSTVSGTIRDANNAAIASATVTLTKSTTGAVYTATTNASGAYTATLADITNYNGSSIADYTISISKTGYVTKTGTVSVVADASTLTGHDYTLVSGGTISGTITTSAGAGLSGVLVWADDGYGNVATATTDATGAYTITGLRASTRYTLTVTKTNYVGQRSFNVAVTVGAATTGKNFTLPAAKSFSGTILDKSSGSVLEGAVVYLFKRNKTRTEIADYSYTTKSDGTFVFRNVSPGKYRVKVAKSGYVTVVQDTYVITSDIAGKNYSMELGGSIYGRITNSSNEGVSSADVAIFALKNGKEVSYASTSTDENGYYLAMSLKKGTYRLRVTSSEYVTKVINVTVKAGVQSTKNMKLSSAGSISGYITDKETGLPVSALVKVVGTATTALSDSNGYFVLDGLKPGTRKVYVVNQYYNTSAKKDIKVSAGKTKTGVTIELTPKQ